MSNIHPVRHASSGDGDVSEVIRPAAIVPEDAARAILVEMALRDIQNGGLWQSEPNLWTRYDRPWHGLGNETGAVAIGTVHVAYGTPTKYEITIYRVTVTAAGDDEGWTPQTLTDEALGYGGLTLEECPRATMAPPPRPFRY